MIKDLEGNEYAEIDVKNTGETEGGAVWFDDGDNKFCVPKSCMEDWPDIGETGVALIHLWFAERQGLV